MANTSLLIIAGILLGQTAGAENLEQAQSVVHRLKEISGVQLAENPAGKNVFIRRGKNSPAELFQTRNNQPRHIPGILQHVFACPVSVIMTNAEDVKLFPSDFFDKRDLLLKILPGCSRPRAPSA